MIEYMRKQILQHHETFSIVHFELIKFLMQNGRWCMDP